MSHEKVDHRGAGLLERLLPQVVKSEESFVDFPEPLFPTELRYIASAVASRRAEYITVRGCARRALHRLGVQREPMVPCEAGVPDWPAGIVGSMTHCTGYRAASAAPTREIRSLGIDAETNEPLPDDVFELISSEEERGILAPLTIDTECNITDRVLFSVKEAVYKAWYPLEFQWLGFRDVDVAIYKDGTFFASLVNPAVRRSTQTPIEFSGRWLATDTHVVTATAVD